MPKSFECVTLVAMMSLVGFACGCGSNAASSSDRSDAGSTVELVDTEQSVAGEWRATQESVKHVIHDAFKRSFLSVRESGHIKRGRGESESRLLAIRDYQRMDGDRFEVVREPALPLLILNRDGTFAATVEAEEVQGQWRFIEPNIVVLTNISSDSRAILIIGANELRGFEGELRFPNYGPLAAFHYQRP